MMHLRNQVKASKERFYGEKIHVEELMAKTLSVFEVLGNFTYLHHDHCH